jgi:hypothetical protein
MAGERELPAIFDSAASDFAKAAKDGANKIGDFIASAGKHGSDSITTVEKADSAGLRGFNATEGDVPAGTVRAFGGQRRPENTPLDPDAVSTRPDGSPWPESPLSRLRQPPGLGDAVAVRDENGLIKSVDGTAVRDQLRDITDERRIEYRNARDAGTIPKQDAAPVVSVLLDTRTGRMYESVNQGGAIPTDLHPVVQSRLDTLVSDAKANPNVYRYDDGESGSFPHFSAPGSHAEVLNVSRALYDREAMGYPVTSKSLGELIIDNRFIYRPDEKMAAPCCPNCTAIIGGIDSIPGTRPVGEMRVQ